MPDVAMPDESAARPDIVLIMTDQQRFDQLGYSSGGHFDTPNLDALASSGVIFDAAYSASTVCVPSRVAILTGVQPHRLPRQENGLALREGFWTIARQLRSVGYETALFGKMHFTPVHAEHGFETMRLCEHLRDQVVGPLSRAHRDEFDDYHYWLLENGLDDYRLADNVGPRSFPYAADDHPTSWVEREATAFLAERDRRRPLFLVVSFPHPHAPYDPPEPYASMFDPADSVLPAVGFEANAHLPMVFQLAAEWSTTRPEAERSPSLRAFLAIVRGLVKQIDDAVGRLLAPLDLASTVVFFTSDHGDFAGHRGLMRKNPWIPFDDLARVPFFAAGAGVVGGRRVGQVVQNADFALSCLDLAGIPAPDGIDFDTKSLRPILGGCGGGADDDRAAYTAISMGWPMVRRGRFKYMVNERPDRLPVLFDLNDDPYEQTNLVKDPAFAQIRDELAALLTAMRSRAPIDWPGALT